MSVDINCVARANSVVAFDFHFRGGHGSTHNWRSDIWEYSSAFIVAGHSLDLSYRASQMRYLCRAETEKKRIIISIRNARNLSCHRRYRIFASSIFLDAPNGRDRISIDDETINQRMEFHHFRLYHFEFEFFVMQPNDDDFFIFQCNLQYSESNESNSRKQIALNNLLWFRLLLPHIQTLTHTLTVNS